VPEITRNERTEMDTNTDDTGAEMCTLQMKAIPIRVGAKTPANIHKTGVPMELYTLAAFTVPPLGAARVALGLHIVMPASTEIILQIWAGVDRYTEQRMSIIIVGVKNRAFYIDTDVESTYGYFIQILILSSTHRRAPPIFKIMDKCPIRTTKITF
jgi:hypothetical protein